MLKNINVTKNYPWIAVIRGVAKAAPWVHRDTIVSGGILNWGHRFSCNYVNLNQFFKEGINNLKIAPFGEKISGSTGKVKFALLRWQGQGSNAEIVNIYSSVVGVQTLTGVPVDAYGTRSPTTASSYYMQAISVLSTVLSGETTTTPAVPRNKAKAYIKANWQGANGIGLMILSNNTNIAAARIGLEVAPY